MASSKSGAGERSGGVEARRESQGPAGYAGACPPLSPSASRLRPWTLAPAHTRRGGSRFIARVCLQRPPPAPGLPPRRGMRGRPAASQAAFAAGAAAALPLLLVSAAPGPRQLMQSLARGAARVKRRCSPLLRPPQTHPPFSPRLSRVKKTEAGLRWPVRRLLVRGVVIRPAPRGAAAWRQRRDLVGRPEERAAPGSPRTAGPFGESGGGHGPRRRGIALRSRAPGAPRALALCGGSEFGAPAPGAFSGCAARGLLQRPQRWRRREQRGSRLRETLRSPGTWSPLASGGGGGSSSGAPARGAHRLLLAPGSRCCRQQPRRLLSHPFVLQSERECTADAYCSGEKISVMQCSYVLTPLPLRCLPSRG